MPPPYNDDGGFILSWCDAVVEVTGLAATFYLKIKQIYQKRLFLRAFCVIFASFEASKHVVV